MESTLDLCSSVPPPALSSPPTLSSHDSDPTPAPPPCSQSSFITFRALLVPPAPCPPWMQLDPNPSELQPLPARRITKARGTHLPSRLHTSVDHPHLLLSHFEAGCARVAVGSNVDNSLGNPTSSTSSQPGPLRRNSPRPRRNRTAT